MTSNSKDNQFNLKNSTGSVGSNQTIILNNEDAEELIEMKYEVEEIVIEVTNYKF